MYINTYTYSINISRREEKVSGIRNTAQSVIKKSRKQSNE